MNHQEKAKQIFKKKIKPQIEIFLRYLESLPRIKIIFGLFIIYGIFLIITAFKYSVMDFDYYSKLANGQQTKVVKNSVSRGTIYSNNDPVGVLSTSTDLSDLAIDPTQGGSINRLTNFLTDIIYQELCTNKEINKCQDNILAFIKVKEIDDWIDSEQYIKTKISDEITKRINKKYSDYTTIKDGLTDEEIKKVQLLDVPGLFLNENSLLFDYNKGNGIEIIIPKLSEILSIPETTIKEKLTRKPIRYIKFLTKLSLSTKDKIDARLEDEAQAIKKGLLDDKEGISKFIILEPHPTRFYPEKNLASQILGFVDNEGQGRYGIEGYFNEELKGQEGVKITKKDISGKAIGLYEQLDKKLVNGSDIKLTIDRNIQKEVSQILEAGIKEYRANKGSVVIMDPKTGAIIAMANYPDFDPNNFGDVYELERVNYSKYPHPDFDLLGFTVYVEDTVNPTVELKYDGKLMKFRVATDRELTNNAVPKYKFKNNLGPGAYVNNTIGSLYEPGSVFKAITTSIGIDTGDINPGDMYMDKGSVQIDNFKISNVSNECIGYHTYAHALDWSCNVGMIDIVKKIGSSLFYKYVNDFGFGAKTNITLEGEVFGKIDPYEKWSRAKLFTQSFGQGITATVLQMATAYSVLANGGVYMQPYIVDTINLPNGQVIKNTPTPLRRVIKEETSKKIIAMLTEGANIGFAKKGGVEGYDMAGKTGTSQIASKGKYEVGTAGHTITSYGGFGPSSNPKFVMIVEIDRPRSAVYSETTSSEMYSKIAKYLLNYYAIPKSK